MFTFTQWLVEADSLDLPKLEVGDTLLVGKFKNRKAEITGFDTDDNGQPVAKTTKGDQKIFKPRIAKLMPGADKMVNEAEIAEETLEGTTYSDEHQDSHHGQHDYILWAHHPSRVPNPGMEDHQHGKAVGA